LAHTLEKEFKLSDMENGYRVESPKLGLSNEEFMRRAVIERISRDQKASSKTTTPNDN
jgi:hypothetical protein